MFVFLLVGIAVTAAAGVLFSLAGDDELLANLQSPGKSSRIGTAGPDDWSDFNDSLGG